MDELSSLPFSSSSSSAFFLPFSCLFFGMFGIELTVTNQFNTILQGDFNVGEWGGELRGSRLEA